MKSTPYIFLNKNKTETNLPITETQNKSDSCCDEKHDSIILNYTKRKTYYNCVYTVAGMGDRLRP
jgi:hypothetical protein